MIYIVLVLIIILIYFLMIMPNLNKKRKNKMSPFEKTYIAHRGLFNNVDIPENSIPAFKKAIEYDYGIELDVQITTDKKLVVFHDADLFRICGINKKVTECSYEELLSYDLLNTQYKIPLFEDVLNLLNDKVPLIVEIKPEGPCIETCDRAIKMLNKYDLDYIVESFNPLVIYHLKHKYPDIIRGQLAYDMLKDPKNKENLFIKFICTNLLTNFLTKPDFIAYDIKARKKLSFKLISKIYKGECVAWTLKDQKTLDECKNDYQQFIFDSFIPK